jgi:hypothetical protein
MGSSDSRNSTRAGKAHLANPLLADICRPPDQGDGFDTTLGHFSDALALTETALRALEAPEIQEEWGGHRGPPTATLRQAVSALGRVYIEFDLLIIELRRAGRLGKSLLGVSRRK